MIAMSKPEAALGLAAFDSLQAEDEPWLDQCFVLPFDFALIAGARSSLVFGAAGSGKTALFQTLLAHLTPSPVKPSSWLVVRWHPIPLGPGVSGSRAAVAQLTHIFSACADALLAHLARWPDRFTTAPGDTRQTLAWFIYRYLGADAEQHIAEYAAQAQKPDSGPLHSLLSCERSNEWLDSAIPATVIAELVKALREIGLRRVNVLLNPDTLVDSGWVVGNLHAFLSSLTLFENHHFVYKMILPKKFKNPLALAGSVPRRRIDLYALDWSVDDLVEIVVRRVAMAIGEPVSALGEICQDVKLTRWLERTGGDSPRGWLKCITPLVTQYLRQGRPISTKEWKTIRAKSPPPLTLDEENDQVSIGWRRLNDLPKVPLALLRHLYDHRSRICSRDELFLDAYLPARYPDSSAEDRREQPKDYADLLDTAIWRLRKEIEPDPRSPIYVVTRRGKGYKLEHAW